jgi:anti-anti-sigma factor
MPPESDKDPAARESASPRIPTPFGVSPERDGEVYLLKASGELDLATCKALRAELERAEASEAKRIVLDLGDLTFIDSTGIEVLLDAHRRAGMNARPLQLLPVNGHVHDVFEITGLMRELTFVTAP